MLLNIEPKVDQGVTSILATSIRKSAEQFQSSAIRKVDPSVWSYGCQCLRVPFALAIAKSSHQYPANASGQLFILGRGSGILKLSRAICPSPIHDALWQSFHPVEPVAAASASASLWPMRREETAKVRLDSRFAEEGNRI